MSHEIITAVVISTILNQLIMFMMYRFFRRRLKGDTGYAGIKGDRGMPGKSAYDLAIEEGFEGTLEEFLKTGFVKPKQYLYNDIEGSGRRTSQPHGNSDTYKR